MKIAVVVPCYKVSAQIIGVVAEIIGQVDGIFVVDDKCPEGSGRLVQSNFAHEASVTVLFHEENQGVGGAMATGYRAALGEGYDIVVKMDGDGQMDPGYIQVLVAPIVHREADYTKGNRFYEIDYLKTMPKMRIFGNSVLSFVNKCSSGYWNIMDPTNGYTAIHATALARLDFSKIAKRYFFESDMLFRLNSIRAVVRDIPMPAVYGDEKSNLKISRVLIDFPQRYLVNFLKRFFYNYILRDLNPASIEAVLGTILVVLGASGGIYNWTNAIITREATPIGTVMLVALMMILGAQFLLAALSYDITNVPKEPLQTVPGLGLRPQPLRGKPREAFQPLATDTPRATISDARSSAQD
jgi:glycosyltransferase involved in cell wall biosynthesis